MKKRFFLTGALALLLSVGMEAQAQVKLPAPSPNQKITQDFGLSSVEVNYARPVKKGRDIMGDLVPYGKIWRTGANTVTSIKFNDDVQINGKPLKAGEYAIYTIPNRGEWEVIFNKGLKNWGVNGYSEADDVLRVKATAHQIPFTLESLLIQFDNVQSTSMSMVIGWEQTLVTLDVTTDIDSRVMASLEAAMKTDKKPYQQAANYYLETGKDLNKALEYAEAAIKENPKAFWLVYLKARIQAQKGDKSGAKVTAQKGIELAKEANNDDYVALNEKLIKSL